MASDVSNDASLGSGHGFTLAQLEKFAETVARTRSFQPHALTFIGWVTTDMPAGVVAVRCSVDHGSPRFRWSHIGGGACIWHDFPSLERQAMADAWYRTRAQAAAEAAAGRDVVEREVKPVDEGTERLHGGMLTIRGVAYQVAGTIERGWQLAIQNGHTIQTARTARPHVEAAESTTNRAPVAQSGPLTIQLGNLAGVNERPATSDGQWKLKPEHEAEAAVEVAKLAEAEFLRRELATPPKGLTLEQWHAFLAHRSEHACGGHYDRRGPEGMTAAAMSALRSDLESGRATVPKRILGNDTQLRHRERSTKPKREWWK